MISTDNIQEINGAKVVGANGDKIGTLGQVYVDEQSQKPLFASVNTGLFGNSESFIPLEDASYEDGEVHVAYTKDKVKDAPKLADDGRLEPDEQDRIIAYYESSWDNDNANKTDADSDLSYSNTDRDGDLTDAAMTRSEQRLKVGTQKVQTGRVALKKHVVTEQQTVTVPVTHEEVRLEREPITDANVGAALDGPELSEEEHEVVLTEERPVVEKETVPVERIRLAKDTVTENHTVSEDVSREEIDFDSDGANNSNLR